MSTIINGNSEKLRKWREANPCLSAAASRRWRERHPEKYREGYRAYQRSHKDKISKDSRARNLKRHNLTPDDYRALLDKQQGKCASCHQPESVKHGNVIINLSVDHDKKCCPGKWSCGRCVRGLLCTRCNILACEVERLKMVVTYLGSFKGRSDA